MRRSSVCSWLMDHADTPIRYRTARELLKDHSRAKALLPGLLDNTAVKLWLGNLKPQSPPQYRWMEHGSFDFCLENAILKLVQLGLHGSLPQLMHAAGYYLGKMPGAASLEHKRKDFITAILTANLLSLAETDNDAVLQYMLASLDELHTFAQKQSVDIYLHTNECQALMGIPACWKGKRPIIKPGLIQTYGYTFPLLYDIVGMHSLYRLHDPEINKKIDTVIRFIATDTFHQAIDDGYGILVTSKHSYLAMGWDPKCPGWFDAAAYLQNGNASRLLFYALHASCYPAFRETKWYRNLLQCLEHYQTQEGRYLFPAVWLPEKQGYAVMGRHMSFGENRRKKNWREIESTFYMLLLKQNPDCIH